jgi:hypothetical protein
MALLLNKDTDFQSQIILSLPFLLLSIPFLVSFLICFFLPSFYLSIQLSIKYKIYLYADDFIPRRPGFHSVKVKFLVDKVTLKQAFLQVLRCSPTSFRLCPILICHRSTGCATALTDQHITMVLVPNLRAPRLIRDNAGVGVNEA